MLVEFAKENGGPQGWGELCLVFEEHSEKGRMYFAKHNGNGRLAPIHENEIMYMRKCQQFYLRHYGFVPPAMTDENWLVFRNTALANAVKQETAIGIKPEEQTVAVIMKYLSIHIQAMLTRFNHGLSFEGCVREIMEIEGELYLIVGEQTVHTAIKRIQLDQMIDVKLDQRQVGNGLRSIPGAVQFNRTNGRSEKWDNLPSNLDRRSKYAAPVKFVQEYRTV